MTIVRGSIDLQSKGEQIMFAFAADGEKLGELYISAGSVLFRPKHKRKAIKWSITQFVKLLEEHY